MDDYWALVFGVPVILTFIPPSRVAMVQGFQALGDVPQWFIIGIGAAYGFAFYRRGFRGIRTVLPTAKTSEPATATAIPATA